MLMTGKHRSLSPSSWFQRGLVIKKYVFRLLDLAFKVSAMQLKFLSSLYICICMYKESLIKISGLFINLLGKLFILQNVHSAFLYHMPVFI